MSQSSKSDKPVVDFSSVPPPDAVEPEPVREDGDKASPAQQEAKPAAGEPAKLSKTQKKLRRWARSGFAVFVAWMPVLSFALTISSLVSGSWATKFITVDETKWTDISPVNGNCTCDTTHTSYCMETSDAFQGTAYLSIVVLGSQLLLAFIYTLELGLYGLFGGSHNFTRITLIVALLALSTAILSVISWYATFSNNHCGDPSFESQGATLGWPFFVRCIECAGLLGFVLYITSLFPKTNRGPPSIPLVTVAFTILITCITTFLRGWMALGDLSYSPWAACKCGDACSQVASMLTMALGTGALACITGFVAIFFMSLRAVDNEGLTLRVASALSGVTVVLQLLVIVGFYLAFNGGCGAPLSDEGFDLFWPSNFAIGAFVSQFAFVVTNTVYMMKAPCELPEGEVEPQNEHEKTIFYRYWWDQLKDPRTLAHEAREEDEDDNAASDSDDDDDGAEEDELAQKDNEAASAAATGAADDEDDGQPTKEAA